MRPIPLKLRNDMSNDPFYKVCCLTGETREKIDFHHGIIFGGRQLNEKWCIVPLARSVHMLADRRDIKERILWIMVNRADTETLIRFSKAIDFLRERDRLNLKFGKWVEGNYIQI